MLPNQGVMLHPASQAPGGSAGLIQGQDVHAVTKMGKPNANQLSRSDSQTALFPVSPYTGTNAQAAHPTSKPMMSEKHGDFATEKSAMLSKEGAHGNGVNELGTYNEAADSTELKVPKTENDLKSSNCEETPLGEIDNKNAHKEHAESAEGDGVSELPVIKPMLKEEVSEKSVSVEPVGEVKEDETSVHDAKAVQDGLPHKGRMSRSAENVDANETVQSHQGTDKGQHGHALGPVMEINQNVTSRGQVPLNERSNSHAPQHSQNVIPTNDRTVPNPGFHDRNSSQFPRQGIVPGENQPMLLPGQIPAKNFVQPSHIAPGLPDQDKYHQLPMPYGPPHMQERAPQRPTADRMLPPSMPPGPNQERKFQEPILPQMQMQGPLMVHMRPQGHNPVESFPHQHQGQAPFAQEPFQPPILKQPFQSEVPPGVFQGPGMSASFGRGPSLLGPPGKGFEPQRLAPGGYNQGIMPPPYAGGPGISQGEPLVGLRPGAFEPTGGIIPRGPPIPEGQMGRSHTTNPIESDMFMNKRSGFIDGRQLDPSMGVVGGMQDTSYPRGLQEERLKPLPEERYKPGLEGFKRHLEDHDKPLPIDSSRHAFDRRESEDLKQFPRSSHSDGENVPKFGSYFSSSRSLDRGPHGFGDREPHLLSNDIGPTSDRSASVQSGSGGGSVPAEIGDRLRPISLRDDLGNTDFPRHVSEFGRHRMDNLPSARSPGREHPGLTSTRFGSTLAGLGLGSQSRLEDFDGRDPRGFGERSKAFNLPSDSIGSTFHESRFPMFPPAAGSGALPNHLHRGELDGPGILRMNEQLSSGMPWRTGDPVGPDFLPLHLRGGEPFGPGSLANQMRGGEPRNLPGHIRLGEPQGPGQLRMGDPSGFGGFRSHLRMGEMAGPGHLPSHLRIGESIGGGIGEARFGGGFPMQGFHGSLKGDRESLDRSRKRKPGSMGWCRICKIDCETVEGLELHSQTGEHQKKAMEMVLSIRQDNAKKQKVSSDDHISREEANKPRKAGHESRGNKQ